MQDERIVELYWLRNEDAISASSQQYGHYCTSIALRILDNAECSEECVNDTWLNAWNAMPPQRPAVLRTFLGAITRNLSLNKVRDLSREKRGGGQAVLVLDELQECIPGTDSPERDVEDQEITAAIDRWLTTLPKENRVAFMRRYWFCDSITEIATRMSWSESKTSSLLRRLRISLKEHLEQEDITL